MVITWWIAFFLHSDTQGSYKVCNWSIHTIIHIPCQSIKKIFEGTHTLLPDKIPEGGD